MTEQITVEEWLAVRRAEGRKIDPATAEVDWRYAQVLDPYGVCPDLPEECDCIGREYFARHGPAVKFGSSLEIYQTRHVRSCGSGWKLE